MDDDSKKPSDILHSQEESSSPDEADGNPSDPAAAETRSEGAPADDEAANSMPGTEKAPPADARPEGSESKISAPESDPEPEAALKSEAGGEAQASSEAETAVSPAAPIPVTSQEPGRVPLEATQGIRAARRPSAASPSLLLAIARSLWEEVVYPRARVKAALRRAEHHAKRYPAASAVALALFVGLPFIMFMSAGFGVGLLSWAVFVGVATFLIVGGPLLLIYAWPLLTLVVATACIWVHFSVGEGALWLGVATISAMLIFYFAATEVVPFMAAAIVAWYASGLGTPVTVVVYCVAAVFFTYYRYPMTGPLLYAGWVFVSGAVSSRLACVTIGDAMPLVWNRGTVIGPTGITLWTLAMAAIAGLLVVPKKRRRGKKTPRIKSIAEQLPP